MKYITITAIVLSLLVSIHAQDCDHTGAIDRFRNLAVTAPAKISRFDGITLEYIASDKQEIETKILTVLPITDLPPDFLKDHKGEYFIFYCLKHNVIYQIQPIKPTK